MNIINNAKFAVIQVMSGRSESNSLFDSGGLEYLTKISYGSKIRAAAAWEELLRENNKNYVKKIVAETRTNWVNNYIRLLESIKIPKILFWFSIRKPSYMEIYLCKQFADLPALFGKSSSNALFGKFSRSQTFLEGLWNAVFSRYSLRVKTRCISEWARSL